ncbi:DNA alkylation repair enzyme [compost metagenome]
MKSFALIERYSADERNFVKKAISWALRGIGKRKSPALRARALAVARRLAKSEDSTTRWIGKDAIRDLAR